jgi:hypothetical protein
LNERQGADGIKNGRIGLRQEKGCGRKSEKGQQQKSEPGEVRFKLFIFIAANCRYCLSGSQ